RGGPALGLAHPGKPPGRPGLPTRELAPRGIVRERAVVRKRMRAYELRSLALGAEAEIFKLHHRYDRIIVIRLDEIDIFRREARQRPQFIDIELPAAAYLHWIVRKGVVPLDRRQDANARQIERLGDIFATHDKGLGAFAWHPSIE